MFHVGCLGIGKLAEVELLAWIIQGETAGLCGFIGYLAVYYVFQRNDVFYGWAQPSYTAWWVAWRGEEYVDPVPNAFFLVSYQDLQMPEVGAYTWERGPPNAVFICAGNLSLWAYPLRVESLSKVERMEAWKDVVIYRRDDIPVRLLSVASI